MADRGDAEVVDGVYCQEALGRDAVGEGVAVGWEGQPRAVCLAQRIVLPRAICITQGKNGKFSRG